MKRIIATLILLVLLVGCAVQQKEITPAEKKRIKEAFIERLYLDYLFKKAEKEFGVEEFGVEPNDINN